MSGDEVDMTSNLLAVAEDMKLQVSMDGIDKDDLEKYIVKQLKETYHKPLRTSGRKPDTEEKYTIPLGIFHIGDNSFVPMDKDDEEGEGEGDDSIEVHNYLKHVDGKIVVTDEEQKEDAERALLQYNLDVKRDIPYQIYHSIRRSGRRTIDELYAMFGAIEKEMFLLVVNNMINKRYLKKVDEVDREIEFSPDETTSFNDAYKIVERKVTTLEIVGEEERKRVLE